MHLFHFLVILSVVAAVSALLKPGSLKKAFREGLTMFFTTALGMGAAALLIHFASL